MALHWLSKQLVLCEIEPFPFYCIIENQGLCVTVYFADENNHQECVYIEFKDDAPFSSPLYITFGVKPLFLSFDPDEKIKVYGQFYKISDWFAGCTLKNLICELFCVWQDAINSSLCESDRLSAHDHE